ncbi:MAG: endo-1,4-beta-xylanase [Oscillospiraceae bacterium]|nr:endo-1,4-beta-xylanase [Oscillospiraceae bacterium]
MNNSKKIAAGIVSAAMLATIASAYSVPSEQVNAEEDVLFSADFEDGELGAFSRRGEDETLEVIDTDAHGGEKSLCVSTRAQGWNGPQVALDDVIKAGEQYIVTAYAKSEYYSQLTLSMQYNDAEGETHYDNVLKQDSKDGSWLEYNTKFSFPAGSTDMYLYFESSDASVKIYVDDFQITTTPDVAIEDLTSLRAYYSDAFKIGTAITSLDLASKPFMKLVDRHFSGSITVGNEMKPDYVLNYNATQKYFEETGDDENPQVSFAQAKPVLDYCLKNNIPVRVHTLVWHSQTPEWFFKENYDASGEYVSKEKMLKRMENYIKNFFETLTELYPTLDFYACDVVNEAWLDDGSPRRPGHPDQSNGYGASDWVAVFGDNSFIEPAFTFARKYAPEGCKLYYNDYNEYMNKKTKIVEMAAELKEKGVIDGIGMQSHLDARQNMGSAFPSVSMYESAIKDYVETGLDVQITELDVTIPENSGDQYFEHQAEYYNGIMDAIEKYKDNISAVVFWGVTDDASWRASQLPLIFDSEYKAKPAFYSIIDGLTPGDIPEVTSPSEPPVTTPAVTTSAAEVTTVSETVTDAPAETTTSSDSTPTETVYGDIDINGHVDVTDLSMLSLYLIGDQRLEGQALLNADADASGEVNIADLARLRQYLSKIIDKLGK